MYEIMEETEVQKVSLESGSADYIVLLPQGVSFAGKKNYEINLCGADMHNVHGSHIKCAHKKLIFWCICQQRRSAFLRRN